jgi:membrane protein implicated in regulation of membrane protease activity
MFKSLTFLVVSVTLVMVANVALAFPGQGMQGTDSPAASPITKSTLEGKVVETMNAGGYTYVCLEKDGKQRWAAMPTTELKVGDEIEVSQSMEMNNFTSKSLGRTFDTIIFSQGVVKR